MAKRYSLALSRASAEWSKPPAPAPAVAAPSTQWPEMTWPPIGSGVPFAVPLRPAAIGVPSPALLLQEKPQAPLHFRRMHADALDFNPTFSDLLNARLSDINAILNRFGITATEMIPELAFRNLAIPLL